MITVRGSATGPILRGSTGALARFAVDWVRVETIITPGDTDEQTIDDAVFEVSTPATVDYEAQAIIRPTHPDADVSQITWSTSDPSIATIDASGKVTRVADGYIRIIATDQHGATARSGLVHIYRESGVEAQTFVRWVDGSLAKAAADAIDSRIAEADPQTDMAIFTTQDHANGIYERNPDCWAADLDLTGISNYSSRNGQLGGGVMISRRDMLASEHWPRFRAGDTVRFVDDDGDPVDMTVDAVKDVGPANSSDAYATDYQVVTFDQDVPSGIKHYPVLPANWDDYIRHLSIGLPTFGTCQHEDAVVQDLVGLGTFAPHKVPTDAQRLAFYKPKIEFDSNKPGMLILDDEPVLVTLWTFGGAGSGPNIARLHDAINAAMTANGSPYQLTVADLSAWTNFAFRDVILSYNPVAYWPFDGDYVDVVGGLTATPVNGPLFAAGAVPNSPGSLSTASTARADVAHSDALNIGTGDDFCASLWVRFLDPPGSSTAYVIFKRSNGSHIAANPGWAMYVTPNGGTAVVSVTDGEHRAYGALSGATSWLVDGNWHHVLFGIDRAANRILMWVDGVSRINSAGLDDGLAAIDSLANAHDLVMCQVSAVIGIDEVAIYKTAPTLAMAQAIYAAGGGT